MSQSAAQAPAENKETKKQEAKPKTVQPPPKSPQLSQDELIASMKSLQDDVGQISELKSEEKRVVDVFFESFLQLMKPLAKTLSVSPTAFPDELGNVKQANVDPKGNLMIMYPGGQVEIRNLNERKERDLMICVMKDVMP
ncbi:MAG: hypothetical protein CW691_04855, partial [Candidatus Bathyarchaeum sp.]